MGKYILTKSKLKNKGKEYVGYGIAQMTSEDIRIIARDISTDSAFMPKLIDKCNKYEASPEHIMDIIYDSVE